MLVGNTVRERIGSVVLWLREQGIDARIIEFALYQDEAEELYLDSKTLVPTSDLEKFETGESPSDQPWEVDGKRWHLEEQTNKDTAALVQDLVDSIDRLESLEGPSWTQKIYIAFRIEGTNRVILRTRANSVCVDIHDFEFSNKDELLDLAATVVDDRDFIVLDTDFQKNRERLRLKCRPEDEVDLDALNELIEELILESEEQDLSG